MKTGMYYNIATIPYYNFVRSGYINIYSGRLVRIGIYSSRWPSTAASNIWDRIGLGAYYLNFNATNASPSSGPTDRWYSYPLRRLSSGGGRLGSDDQDHSIE